MSALVLSQNKSCACIYNTENFRIYAFTKYSLMEYYPGVSLSSTYLSRIKGSLRYAITSYEYWRRSEMCRLKSRSHAFPIFMRDYTTRHYQSFVAG